MKKKFDCVEMKHRAGDRIYEATKGMTVEEEMAYWEQRNRRLRERHQKALAKRKTS